MDILKNKKDFLKFYGGYIYKNNIFLCMEYCELGDLDDFLKNSLQNNNIDINYKKFCYDILNILKILQQNKITHRDIKLTNFLVKKTKNRFTLKLVDFGLSSESQDFESDRNLTSQALCGCYMYKSPIFKNFYFTQKNNKKININCCYNAYNEDLFSVACIMYIMKNKKNPDFCSEIKSSNNLHGILDNFQKDIKSFQNYFSSENFLNNEKELYNKIFLKFKNKKDNNIIDINEFINEFNSKKI